MPAPPPLRQPVRVLIPSTFNYRKYFPRAAALPYEATGAKLRDEILRRRGDLEVTCPTDADGDARALANAQVMISYGIARRQLDGAANLRWIQAGSAGTDHFFRMSDVNAKELSDRGILLTNAAGVQREVIAQQVLAYLLMFVRDMPRAFRQQYEGRWENFCADELGGQTLGLVGFGGIGSRVAELAACFGLRVLALRRRPAEPPPGIEAVLGPRELPELLGRSDFVVLCCPATEETRGMIDATALGRMKQGAYLINVGRGELVDLDALAAALAERRIAGAALDVFGSGSRAAELGDMEALPEDSPLWTLENVILTPNNASGTRRIYEHLANLFLRNLDEVLAGREPPGRVA